MGLRAAITRLADCSSASGKSRSMVLRAAVTVIGGVGAELLEAVLVYGWNGLREIL